MKRIRIRLKSATLVSGTMPEARAKRLCGTIVLPTAECVEIIDA